MKLMPLLDYVLVECEPEKKSTPGGILIPETVKHDLTTGRVVAVGPGTYHDGMFVNVCVTAGQKILFEESVGLKVHSSPGKSELRILKEVQILCVIEDESDADLF